MKKVKLLTRSGEYVGTVEIPGFTIKPKCICWGQRHFFLKDDDYYEDLIWYVPHVTEDSINEP